MTKQIQTIAFAAFIAFVLPFAMLPILGMQTAEAKQGSATMPSKPRGHWTYRLIDGRKCWYEGDSKISKALLLWPEQVRAVSLSARAEQRPEQQRLSPVAQSVGTNTEKPDNQARPEAPLKDSESFEARWRPVEMRPLRN